MNSKREVFKVQEEMSFRESPSAIESLFRGREGASVLAVDLEMLLTVLGRVVRCEIDLHGWVTSSEALRKESLRAQV